MNVSVVLIGDTMQLIKNLSVQIDKYTKPHNRQFMRVFIGFKLIATLQWMEPVLPGGDARWWLLEDNEEIQVAGFSDVDAIDFTLRYIGYTK